MENPQLLWREDSPVFCVVGPADHVPMGADHPGDLCVSVRAQGQVSGFGFIV